MNREQEDKVLETFKYKVVYQENLEEMFLQAYDCQLALEDVESSYLKLSSYYDQLRAEYDKLNQACNEELERQRKQKEELQKQAATETERKKRWRRVAIGEGVGLGVIILLIVAL